MRRTRLLVIIALAFCLFDCTKKAKESRRVTSSDCAHGLRLYGKACVDGALLRVCERHQKLVNEALVKLKALTGRMDAKAEDAIRRDALFHLGARGDGTFFSIERCVTLLDAKRKNKPQKFNAYTKCALSRGLREMRDCAPLIARPVTMEAIDGLEKIKTAASSYFRAQATGKHFPRVRHQEADVNAWQTSGWAPVTPCCRQPKKECAADPRPWDAAIWRTLRFRMKEPHLYQWRYSSGGIDRKAMFTAEARGDLDCDGHYSSYKIIGSVDATLGVVLKGPIVEDETE